MVVLSVLAVVACVVNTGNGVAQSNGRATAAESFVVPASAEKLARTLLALHPSSSFAVPEAAPVSTRRMGRITKGARSRGGLDSLKMMPPPKKNRRDRRKKQKVNIWEKRGELVENLREEWTLCCENDELGDELGDTKAVEAGREPTSGQNYIWTLVRGEHQEEDEPAAPEQTESGKGMGMTSQADSSSEGSEPKGPAPVWAFDSFCKACRFPLLESEVKKVNGEYILECGNCGSSYYIDGSDGAELGTDNTDAGRPKDWLPGEGPRQWIMKQANKDKDPDGINQLKTRVDEKGIWIRLPDGTLPSIDSAEDRARRLQER